ncbi:MAG: FtsX-like permease family protein [Cytophagales bacterium]|nr:FtsX-like permease family protein [Cytophagales bacterium]
MSKQPPKLPLRFLRWFCDPEMVEDIEGDLVERFEHRNKQNKSGRRLFTLDVLKLFRPGIIRPLNLFPQMTNIGMIGHFLLLTIRSFKKEKSYAFINLLGLSLAFCVSLMIGLYVYDQEQFDSYHLNAHNKYRINYNFLKDGELVTNANTTYGLGPEVIEKISGIKQMSRVRPVFEDESPVISNLDNSRKFQENGIYYVEKNFLQMLNYPMAHGDAETALMEPNSMVLTQETAQKFFGDENPVGKQLRMGAGPMSGNFIITGLLDDLPAGTHLDFDYLLPVDYLLANFGLYVRNDGWAWENFYTYFELEEGKSPGEITPLIDQLVEERIGHILESMELTQESSFQPIADIYLDPHIPGDGGLYKGSPRNLLLFSVISLVLLVVASINFINLASARAFKKTGEVALRKALGANKRQLLGQFLFEALCFILLAIGLAFSVAYVLIPYVNDLLNLQLSWSLLDSSFFWQGLLVAVFGLTLATGMYPALLSVKSASSRNTIQLGKNGLMIKKGLIIFQLLTSLLLIAGTWLVFHQLQFMQNQQLGMELEKLFVVKGSRTVVEEGHEVRIRKQNQFKQRLLERSDIQAISATSNVPSTGEVWNGGIRKLGDPRTEETSMDAIMVDRQFIDTFGFELVAGSTFPAYMGDMDAVIINERALKSLGLQNPAEALEHSVVLEDMDTIRIWGVVKDVNWNSLHDFTNPTIFCVNDYAAFLTIKINLNHVHETLSFIENTYRELYHREPYISFFLDQEFNLQYEEEARFSQVFGTFSMITILISGMGILALITFTLSQRMKEIGIRKVLGANARQLFQLLSNEYIQILGLAFLLGGPIIFWGARTWLSNYAYRLPIGWELFSFPLICVALMTLLLISGKILRAMRVNPAKQLRDE